MNKSTAIGILLVAAIFEAGGDALIRSALHRHAGGVRWLTFLGGAAILFGYGVIVNAPDWNFGRLLGLYVVFFFVVAQLLSWVFFHQPPSASTMVGGTLIIAGGVVLGMANT